MIGPAAPIFEPSPAEKTSVESKQFTRERLIEGATALAGAGGEAALTTRQIAKTAGLSQSTFYSYFPDRESCLEQVGSVVAHRVYEPFQAALMAFSGRTRSEESPPLVELCRRLLRDLLDHRTELRVYLRYRSDTSSPLGLAIQATRRTLLNQIREQRDQQRESLGLVLPPKYDLGSHFDAAEGSVFGICDGLVQGRIEDVAGAAPVLAKVLPPLLVVRTG